MKLRKEENKYPLIVKVAIIVLSFFLANLSTVLAGPPNEPEDGATPRPGYSSISPGGLTYHSGFVIHDAHATYSVFWLPPTASVSSSYQFSINRFLKDVSADSGKTTNIYSSISQYTDGTGAVPYQSTFGGSVVTTVAFPGNGCVVDGFTVCLTDAQLRTQLKLVLQQQNWTPTMSKIFFLFLPKGVASCYTGSNTFCSPSNYCAYHFHEDVGNDKLLYAVIPYAMSAATKCGSQSHPNGDDADSTINLVAHEHNEVLSDPQHTAWYDADGRERADRCVWQFGQALGWTSYGRYNQVINGNKYWLQLMWSNSANKCVQSGT